MAKKTNCKKNGINYFRTSITVGREADGTRRLKEFYGKTKKEAENKKIEYKRMLDSGLSIGFDKIKFGDLMKEWIYATILQSERATSTKERYEGIFRNYILNTSIYNVRLTDIKTGVLQKYYNKLLEENKTVNSVLNAHKLIKLFLNYVVDEGYLLKNPAKSKHLSISKEKREKQKIEIFSDDELKALRENLRGNYLEPIILLALGSGLREGEILGLKWTDLNFNEKTITVERTLRLNKHITSNTEYYYKLETQTPKSNASIRTVSLPTSIVDIMKNHKKKQDDLMKKGLENDGGFIFVTGTGNPLYARNLLRAYKRFLKKCGLKERTFHTLRHTYATKLFEKNVSLKVVQTLLGHSNVSITANIYTHVMPNKLHEAVSVIDEYFI